MNKYELRERFRELSIYTNSGYKAPHKPLVLFKALAQVQHGPRWLPYSMVKECLAQFGKDGANDPFWRLKNDPGLFWEVQGAVPAQRRGDIDAPTELELVDWRAEAGFTEDVRNVLLQNRKWIGDLAKFIFDEHTKGFAQEEMFRAAGLDL
jgi:hypothetical protein